MTQRHQLVTTPPVSQASPPVSLASHPAPTPPIRVERPPCSRVESQPENKSGTVPTLPLRRCCALAPACLLPVKMLLSPTRCYLHCVPVPGHNCSLRQQPPPASTVHAGGYPQCCCRGGAEVRRLRGGAHCRHRTRVKGWGWGVLLQSTAERPGRGESAEEGLRIEPSHGGEAQAAPRAAARAAPPARRQARCKHLQASKKVQGTIVNKAGRCSRRRRCASCGRGW